MTMVRVPTGPTGGAAEPTVAEDEVTEEAEIALPGLPRGIIDLAARRWREAEPVADAAGLMTPSYDDAALRRRLEAELTAPRRLGQWPDPNPPRAVTGGWVNDEVIDEDRAAFESLIDANPDAGPETLAGTAQELRWPVTPYRRIRHDSGAVDDQDRARSVVGRHPVAARSRRPIVVDLSTHWAGPLATSLLAEAGAAVYKIDPDCRPDGFRARQGLYQHLNGAKTVIDLDLRRPPDRQRFESLLADADLLVESFSRRVLPNLGYDHRRLADLNPALSVISIKAFPASSPEADWLAYGPGVHATSGLGWLAGQDRPAPAPIAYPDLVAGVTAYAEAIATLATGAGCEPTTGEVTLAGSIAPLVALARDTSASTDG